MSKKYVGIDIGGTNLKAGVVDETGTLLSAAKTPLQFTTPEAFVETLAGLSRQAAEAAGIGAEEICAVGMGVPGTGHRRRRGHRAWREAAARNQRIGGGGRPYGGGAGWRALSLRPPGLLGAICFGQCAHAHNAGSHGTLSGQRTLGTL